VKLVTSVDSKSTDLSRAGNWCFETETEEPTNETMCRTNTVVDDIDVYRCRDARGIRMVLFEPLHD